MAYVKYEDRYTSKEAIENGFLTNRNALQACRMFRATQETLCPTREVYVEQAKAFAEAIMLNEHIQQKDIGEALGLKLNPNFE